MSIRNMIVKTKIENEIVELMVKTNVSNVYLEDNTTTLAAKLSEIITGLAGKITADEVDTKITTAINELKGEVPETYDTLKEILDLIKSNETIVNALNSAIGNKVDKVDGYGLSKNDLTDELLEKINNATSVVVDAELSTESENAIQNKVVKAALDSKVDAREGYGLSKNDLTDELLDKINNSTSVTVDAELSAESENPVQNKVVKAALDLKADATELANKSNIYIQSAEPENLKVNDLWLEI